jgi:prophage regulatory protein
MQTHTNPLASRPEALLRLPAVEARVGLKKSSIYEMLGRTPPAFPRPVKLSRRAVVWPASAIDAWITERIKEGSQ